MIVEQVIDFTAIDFIHGDGHGEVSLIILPVVYATLEQILNGKVLQTLHRERLS